jgi:hypothetical protein
MYDMGSPAPPEPTQCALGRKSYAQTIVTREREAGHEDLCIMSRARHLSSALPRSHQLDLMSSANQPVQQAPDGHRYAIDLGRKGLCHDGDAQSDTRAR